jgi:hypothetical protein
MTLLRSATGFCERSIITATVHNRRHTPPPGLAFGKPDDRLLRGIQHAAAPRFTTPALEYWIIRWSLSSGGALRRPVGG